MSFSTAALGGTELTVCRTGYTGELGYELVVPAGHAVAVWDALFAAGEAYELRACGLAARDTLRTRWATLHGHELSLDITPVQARTGWAVGWRKPAFWGREVLLAERRPVPAARCAGWRRWTGRSRVGMSVYVGDTAVGTVTSGTFSPTPSRASPSPLDTAAALSDGDTVESYPQPPRRHASPAALRPALGQVTARARRDHEVVASTPPMRVLTS
jgi:aminomethyltransferase